MSAIYTAHLWWGRWPEGHGDKLYCGLPHAQALATMGPHEDPRWSHIRMHGLLEELKEQEDWEKFLSWNLKKDPELAPHFGRWCPRCCETWDRILEWEIKLRALEP